MYYTNVLIIINIKISSIQTEGYISYPHPYMLIYIYIYICVWLNAYFIRAYVTNISKGGERSSVFHKLQNPTIVGKRHDRIITSMDCDTFISQLLI